MPRATLLTAVAGVLIAASWGAAAQMDRPADRPLDRSYERPNDRPSGTYEGMLTGAKEQRQGNVTFITGGVSKDEAEAFRAAMGRYALSLEFARANAPRGDFLAHVEVDVIDSSGRTVLETRSEGPFVLANLPPGSYTVRAESNGQAKTKTVNVTAGQNRHLVFTW